MISRQPDEEANGRITASTATLSFHHDDDDGDAEAPSKRSWGFTLLSTDPPNSASLVRTSQHDHDDVDDGGHGDGELHYNTNESCSVDSCEGAAANSSAASFSSSKHL